MCGKKRSERLLGPVWKFDRCSVHRLEDVTQPMTMTACPADTSPIGDSLSDGHGLEQATEQ